MSFMVVLGIFAVSAYLLQILFGMKQIKHFNQTYQRLRRQGKVAIGRRAGKFKAGTIVMFAVDGKGNVLEAVKMQGVTVMAQFKDLPHFKGHNIHDFTLENDLVQQENKLMRQAIVNGREIYMRVEAGNYVEETPMSPYMNAKVHAGLLKDSVQNKFRRGVE